MGVVLERRFDFGARLFPPLGGKRKVYRYILFFLYSLSADIWQTYDRHRWGRLTESLTLLVSIIVTDTYHDVPMIHMADKKRGCVKRAFVCFMSYHMTA